MSSWYSDRPDDYYTTPDADSADLINISGTAVQLDLQSDREAWMQDANCKGVRPAVFEQAKPSRLARKTCGGCAVIADCLRFAMASPYEQTGFQAGLTGPERERLTVRMAA